MPAKISTVCYVHEATERLTQEYTVKEITAVSRLELLDDDDPTRVLYLKVKALIQVLKFKLKILILVM